MKLISWHKETLNKFKSKFNLTDYQVAWISFAKGVAVGLLICHLL